MLWGNLLMPLCSGWEHLQKVLSVWMWIKSPKLFFGIFPEQFGFINMKTDVFSSGEQRVYPSRQFRVPVVTFIMQLSDCSIISSRVYQLVITIKLSACWLTSNWNRKDTKASSAVCTVVTFKNVETFNNVFYKHLTCWLQLTGTPLKWDLNHISLAAIGKKCWYIGDTPRTSEEGPPSPP